MKTLIIASALALTSVASFAGTTNGETWGQQTSASGPSLTRAQVVADLQTAQVNQTMAYGEHAAPDMIPAASSTLLRRSVRQAVVSQRHVGQLPVSGERSMGDIFPGQL